MHLKIYPYPPPSCPSSHLIQYPQIEMHVLRLLLLIIILSLWLILTGHFKFVDINFSFGYLIIILVPLEDTLPGLVRIKKIDKEKTYPVTHRV